MAVGADAAVPGLLSEQEWNPEGHTTRIIETLQFFVGRLPFNFNRSFTFECQENRTSWFFRVKFHSVLMDNSGTCEVTLRRLDNAPIDMGTDLWMRPILPFEYTDLCTNILTADGIVPRFQAKKIIPFMPIEALILLGNRPIQLEVFFRIRRCHSDLGLAGLVEAVYQERYPPPPLYHREEMSVLYYSPEPATPLKPFQSSS